MHHNIKLVQLQASVNLRRYSAATQYSLQDVAKSNLSFFAAFSAIAWNFKTKFYPLIQCVRLSRNSTKFIFCSFVNVTFNVNLYGVSLTGTPYRCCTNQQTKRFNKRQKVTCRYHDDDCYE